MQIICSFSITMDFIKTYTSKKDAHKVFERYKHICSRIENKDFSIPLAKKVVGNSLYFQYINIIESFADRYRNDTVSNKDFYLLWKHLCQFHKLINNWEIEWNILLHWDFGWWNYVYTHDWVYIIDCEKPMDNSSPDYWSKYYDIARLLLLFEHTSRDKTAEYFRSYIIWYNDTYGKSISLSLLYTFYRKILVWIIFFNIKKWQPLNLMCNTMRLLRSFIYKYNNQYD